MLNKGQIYLSPYIMPKITGRHQVDKRKNGYGQEVNKESDKALNKFGEVIFGIDIELFAQAVAGGLDTVR